MSPLAFPAICAGVYLLSFAETYVRKQHLAVALVAVVWGTMGLCN